MKILDDILFELKRIANALESQANTKLERVPETPAPPIEYFDSTQPEEDELLKEQNLAQSRLDKKLISAEEKGFFFGEDAISREDLEELGMK